MKLKISHFAYYMFIRKYHIYFIFLFSHQSLLENPQCRGITTPGSRSYFPQILKQLLSDLPQYYRLCFSRKLCFSCFYRLFLEAKQTIQCVLTSLGNKILVNIHICFRKYVSMLGDLLSPQATLARCVHSGGPLWGFGEGSAGADAFLVCRPM